jgi:hypothetical protein
MTIPHIAATEATERSTWPAIRRNVPGIAIIPMTAMFVTMLRPLVVEKKTGLVIEKKMTRANRTTTRPRASGSCRFVLTV